MIDDEIVAVGAFEVKLSGGGGGGVGFEDGAFNVLEGVFGFGEIKKSADLLIKLLGGFSGGL